MYLNLNILIIRANNIFSATDIIIMDVTEGTPGIIQNFVVSRKL